MAHAPDLIVQQLSEIVAARRNLTNLGGYIDDYDAKLLATRARAAIERFAPPGSTYGDGVAEVDKQDSSESWRAEQLVAIVQALRDDYRSGSLIAVEEIVHADLFDDFLDMAKELATKGFIGSAAVLAGTVQEEQLRKLAKKHGLDLLGNKGRSLSVNALGIELRKAEVISEVQRKSLDAWYAQRTEGAHGRADSLNGEEIERMIDGIRDFIGRNPA